MSGLIHQLNISGIHVLSIWERQSNHQFLHCLSISLAVVPVLNNKTWYTTNIILTVNIREPTTGISRAVDLTSFVGRYSCRSPRVALAGSCLLFVRKASCKTRWKQKFHWSAACSARHGHPLIHVQNIRMSRSPRISDFLAISKDIRLHLLVAGSKSFMP